MGHSYAMEGFEPISVAIGVGIGFACAMLLPALKGSSKSQINPSIEKEKEKVVNMTKASDAYNKDGKVVYCRCWRSKTFPLCDGSHNKYNKESGDNVGPLIVSKQTGSKCRCILSTGNVWH